MKAIVLLLLIALCLCDSCGENCPSGTCKSCPCGSSKKEVDVAEWCSRYSWNQNCCKCIVQRESQGNANFMNFQSQGTFKVGLLQIQQVFWSNCNKAQAPCSPESNLQCAIMAYQFYENSWIGWDSHKACGCQ